MQPIRIGRKGPFTAFRWRGAPGGAAAPAAPQGATAEGPGVNRRRKLLEVQPPGLQAGGAAGCARVLEGLPRASR